MNTLSQTQSVEYARDLAVQLRAAVGHAERLDQELDQVRADRENMRRELRCLESAYLDLLARYRALLSGSLPAVERAAINEAAALASAGAAGAARADMAA